MISVMLTPLEATQRCQTEGSFIHDGVSYTLDGPREYPKSERAVFATHIESGTDFAPTGEGAVTEETDWLPMWF